MSSHVYREKRPTKAAAQAHARRRSRSRSRSRDRAGATVTATATVQAYVQRVHGGTAAFWAKMKANAAKAAEETMERMKSPEQKRKEFLEQQAAVDGPRRIKQWMESNGICPACFVNHEKEAAKKNHLFSSSTVHTVLEAPYDPTTCKGCKACATGQCGECEARLQDSQTNCQCIRCHQDVRCTGNITPIMQTRNGLFQVFVPVPTAVTVSQMRTHQECKRCCSSPACMCCANCKVGENETNNTTGCRRRLTLRAHCDEVMCVQCGMALDDHSTTVSLLDSSDLPLRCDCCMAENEAEKVKQEADKIVAAARM